jgi:hypothetical protein
MTADYRALVNLARDTDANVELEDLVEQLADAVDELTEPASTFGVKSRLMLHLGGALGVLGDETGYRSASASWEVEGALMTVTVSVGEIPEDEDE